jgi:RHS repeat-associated protein
VISQHSPDGGLSNFWYDRLGRLTISQNAKQKIDTNYSYTLYDTLGRITEVGQKKQTTQMTDAISRNQSSLNTWLGYTYIFEGGTVIAEQVTRTIYDIKDDEVGALPPGLTVNTAFQKAYTLRNRVSSTRFYDKLPILGGNIGYGLYNSSSIYSYDIHGNVDTLLHDYQSGLMAQPSVNIDRFKVIAYQYDLISGKVNQVHYQPGMTDQLYHRYEYDAENRLTDVYITDRKELIGIPVLEEHDARYSYYKHGPLARTVLGQQMVQGIDYAYTLQGWLKGVNSDTLTDADATASAIDAYRFSLNYFNGDYNAIGSSVKSIVFAGHSAHLPDGDFRPLFNGNISSMVVGIPKLGETMLYNYGYDQLNRLTKMDAWTGYNTATHTWGTLDNHDGAYKERIAYDGNGNILKYLRNGYQGKEDMDSLSYKYNRDVAGNLKNNKLRHIRDAVSEGQYTEDIDSQADDNYSYDPIGNLIKDTKDSIDNITWTVYGKIKKIEKTNGTDIVYTYDPGGNRISKSVINGTDTTITWYVRDAQGNPMGVYSGRYGSLALNEHHLYGSSRLGIWNRNLSMLEAPDPNNGNFVRGNKFFELTNHLGNVLVTISDRKFGHDGGGGVIDYYTPDVVNGNDYYPFGMLQPGRKFSAGGLYRYGFNGKENDNDVKGEGNSQDYGMRIYDPRAGRFLSTDPISKSYPELTPYQFASNRPIEGVDLDGKEFSQEKLKAILAQTKAKLGKAASESLTVAQGFGDAFANANTIGISDHLPRWLGGTNHLNDYDNDYERALYLKGRILGDVAAGLQGGSEVGAGASTAAAGGAMSSTGVGSIGGVPTAILGGVVAGHGAAVGGAAALDIGWALKKLSGLEGGGDIGESNEKSPEESSNDQTNSAHGSENASASNASGTGSANPYSKQTKEQNLSTRKSYEKLIAEHKQKISDFKKDPIGQSDPLWLLQATKDNPSKETLLKRALGRVPALEKQLQKQEGELHKVNEALKTQ